MESQLVVEVAIGPCRKERQPDERSNAGPEHHAS
jgi:hypothetical protein